MMDLSKFTSNKKILSIIVNVVNSVRYRPVRPEYTVPAGNPVRLTPMFRIGKNTDRFGLVPTVPANIGCTGRYLNTGPKHKKACFVNFDIFKGKIVILLNPNSKTLALPSSRTARFLSFFLSHALSQLLCSLTLSANLSLTLSAAPLLCLSLAAAALSLTLCLNDLVYVRYNLLLRERYVFKYIQFLF